MARALLFLFIVLPYISSGQCLMYAGGGFPSNFEDLGNAYLCQFYRDTTDTINAWQVGIPQKPILTTAYSGTRVIITDSVNRYRVNDTSTFAITHRVGSATLGWHLHQFYGYYFVNSDTLTDYGLIEFSPDNGHTWVDIVHDTTGLANWTHSSSFKKPVLSGNSFGWRQFNCIMNFSGAYTFDWGDTVKYRFSFITDTVDTHKDGLMFDNIGIFDVAEDVPFVSSTNHIISVYPNPAADLIHLNHPANTSQKTIHILNHTGAIVNKISNFSGAEIDVSHLPPGIYLLKYTDEQYIDALPFHILR